MTWPVLQCWAQGKPPALHLLLQLCPVPISVPMSTAAKLVAGALSREGFMSSRCPVSFCFIAGLLFPVVMGQGSLLTGISQPSQPCVTGVVVPVVTVSAG